MINDWEKLCKVICKEGCQKCPISNFNNGTRYGCSAFIWNHYDAALEGANKYYEGIKTKEGRNMSEKPKFKTVCERCGQVSPVRTNKTGRIDESIIRRVEDRDLGHNVNFICCHCGNSTTGDNDE